MSTIDSWLAAPGLFVVYDGLCPFCSAYIKVLRLRQSVGKVTLVDARSDPQLVKDFADRGLDLNDGMAVIYGSRIYYGSDAMNILSCLTTSSGIANQSMAAILRNPKVARTLYPVLRSGRAITLALLRRPSLRSS